VRDESLSEDEIRQGIVLTLAKVTAAKLPGHGINDPSFIQPTRPMSAIGG
jgi:cyclic pyranopterin phosphate synthase